MKRRNHLRNRYGITTEDYNKMLFAQNGVCRICGGDKSRSKSEHFHVDHCHKTGEVRGLLCGPCNTRLGWYESHHEGIRLYLEEFNA